MKNQRGITLLELLVIISIMGFIFVPISNLVFISLKTEKEVSIRNDIQREARFIMEYVTEEMRDSDVYWNNYGSGSKKLIDYSANTSHKELIVYERKTDSNKGTLKKNGIVLSESIKEFTVTKNKELINLKLTVEKHGFEFELQSDVIHQERFQ